jgi:hypothetical protein
VLRAGRPTSKSQIAALADSWRIASGSMTCPTSGRASRPAADEAVRRGK